MVLRNASVILMGTGEYIYTDRQKAHAVSDDEASELINQGATYIREQDLSKAVRDTLMPRLARKWVDRA